MQRVLDKIRRRDGMRFSQIQKFIVEMNGLDWNRRDTGGRRAYRGYWCDYLLRGGMYQKRPGILERFCIKGPDKKWRIKP